MGSDEPPRFTDGFEEHRDEAGAPRHAYAELLGALERVDLEQLRAAVAEHLERRKVTFGGQPFVVDPVPRLLEAREWTALSEGLVQRTRALNRFLRDAYAGQEIVRAGIVSAEAIQEAEGFEPDLVGRLPQRGWPAAVIGFDVVRDAQGEFLLLEDNVRTPSGFAYALAARDAVMHNLPPGCPRPRPIDPIIYDLLGRTFQAAAPEGVKDPSIVVLTDGPDNVAYYEHEEAAARLDAPLVTPRELVADGERLRVRLPGGTRGVDSVYRRTDEDRIRDEHGELTDVARVLLPAWLSGNVGLVNAFGNGLADDKLIHGHVEDFIRFYLEEEPLVRSVPTQPLDTEAALRETLDTLQDLVVKPRHGHGGAGVVIGPHADSEDLDRLASELERHPERYVTQPTIPLSRHPTVIEGRLEPRHIDLRAFAFAGQEVLLPPGGLSRMALDAGALVVNSSQEGGGKDTWVLD
jgi:uncharacterized circularly permuted ATP-grasp superfamily protein